jgi:hypothetical protein
VHTQASSVARPTCRFDAETIRAWLASDHPGTDTTVAESLGIGADFDIYGFERWTRIAGLLTEAQASGVFGFDNASIGVLHLAGERGFVNAHRIILQTPGRPTMCSDELDTLDLLTEHLYGADAAVHLLAHTARTADVLHQDLALLHQPEPLQLTTVDTPTRPLRSARAFRPLAIDPQPLARLDPTTPRQAPGRRRS